MKKLNIIIITLIASLATNAQTFYNGVDLSYVNELEDCGAIYSDENAVEADPYKILADKGANIVRLRLWHNPQWTNYSNFADVKKSIARAKANSMVVMLDFHYSDFWTDPERQWRPEAWNGIVNDDILGDSVYQYTFKTLEILANEDLLPEYVQIGNEINGNILIERTNESIDNTSPGLSPVNWSRQVSLLHRGIEAVQQINTNLGSSVKTVMHVAQPENTIWWFEDAISNGLTGFDVIGLSYYPEWSEFSIREVGDQIKFLKDEYQKEVMVVETGYPWTTSSNDGANNNLGNGSKFATYNNTISKEVQRNFLTELSYLIKENGGSGLIYWEPAWISSECSTYWAKGSHYENAALFDFDNKLHIGAEYLSLDHTQMPAALKNQEVTFSVDMKGIDISNGAFVTGDFTGEPWTFESMTNIGDNIFEFVASIPGRSSGPYIFYNNNDWDNQYRESVPISCAKYWDTHREYIIKDAAETYKFTWGKCSINSTSSTNKMDVSQINIYPTLALNYITINSEQEVQSVVITNLNGQDFAVKINSANIINIAHLKPGIYLIKVKTLTKTITNKFIKQ